MLSDVVYAGRYLAKGAITIRQSAWRSRGVDLLNEVLQSTELLAFEGGSFFAAFATGRSLNRTVIGKVT